MSRSISLHDPRVLFVPEGLCKRMSHLRSPWATWRTGDSSTERASRLSRLEKRARCEWNRSRPWSWRIREWLCVAEEEFHRTQRTESLFASTPRSCRTWQPVWTFEIIRGVCAYALKHTRKRLTCALKWTAETSIVCSKRSREWQRKDVLRNMIWWENRARAHLFEN